MRSEVFFTDVRARYTDNLPTKIGRLLDTAGLSKTIKERDLVAVKLHFGEQGNTAFIRPPYIRKIVEQVKGLGGVPFLTDSNTLYAGTRTDAPTHITTAIQNGFAYPVVDAPIIISDGLKGESKTTVVINQNRFKRVYIGSTIAKADCLVSVAHFKCHELTGFAGTLKNIGMGCASRKGKLAQHSTVSPKVKRRRCVGCGDCLTHCPADAISLTEAKAGIDGKACIGCGECISICPNGAIQIQWDQTIPAFMESMVEYTMGVLKGKKGKSLCVNFVTDVSPACDCEPYNDAPIVRDIGILASVDPVAIDQAAVDLVNREPVLPGSCIETPLKPGEDKFKCLFPKIDWEIQLDYGERLGLGSRQYDLISL